MYSYAKNEGTMKNKSKKVVLHLQKQVPNCHSLEICLRHKKIDNCIHNQACSYTQNFWDDPPRWSDTPHEKPTWKIENHLFENGKSSPEPALLGSTLDFRGAFFLPPSAITQLNGSPANADPEPHYPHPTFAQQPPRCDHRRSLCPCKEYIYAYI